MNRGKSNGCTFHAKLPTICFYFRAKTGLAEPFAFFCSLDDLNPENRDLTGYIASIPFLMLTLAEANDILRYKLDELNVPPAGEAEMHLEVMPKMWR
ncbi:Pc13g14960 [Penicillium rubens Wisconsin 54-1255]|uniref:Pc13g14960 protein n=1 Tax=Penicillium rubens (strain ATCC 28089 / DSM 1075 / NRRL 1951 / Wisconsin 54-1255) TaxID=500485 RepID=B6H2P7_PENRW|nr:Pc13g14960 [Penicillium rubens Wisconsin 54-1255]